MLEASDAGWRVCRGPSNYRGYRFDIGGHRFFSKVPLINELWHEILGEEFLLRPRLSRIYYNQHFFDYPLKPLNALAGLGPVESLLVGLSYVKAQVLPPSTTKKPSNSGSPTASGIASTDLLQDLYRKGLGHPLYEISADWAAQRIKNLSLEKRVRNAFSEHNRAWTGDA